MGVNSIRTSHNPPASELLDLCDQYGILVLDEFFDEWEEPKVKNGYAKYFKDNVEKEVREGRYSFEDSCFVYSMPRTWRFEKLGRAHVSHSIEKTKKLMAPYVENLCEEIKLTGEIAKDVEFPKKS